MQPLGLAADAKAGLVHVLDGCRGDAVAHRSVRAGAETSGRRHTHLDDVFGSRRDQGRDIRVGYDEIDALEPGIDHVVHGVTARAENGNPRRQFADIQSLQLALNGLPPPFQCGGGSTAE